MSQHEIADLFGCFVAKVNANIRSILRAGLLDETEVCRTYRYDNGNRVTQYNLEMIVALAFSVRSQNADLFRRWLVKRAIAGTAARHIVIIGNRSGDILSD